MTSTRFRLKVVAGMNLEVMQSFSSNAEPKGEILASQLSGQFLLSTSNRRAKAKPMGDSPTPPACNVKRAHLQSIFTHKSVTCQLAKPLHGAVRELPLTAHIRGISNICQFYNEAFVVEKYGVKDFLTKGGDPLSASNRSTMVGKEAPSDRGREQTKVLAGVEGTANVVE
jgi:hypothetical protein